MASSDAIGAEETAIDGAVSQTAVEAWDERWATSEGRADWLEPHPAVVAILPQLHARGARRVLDLGCGVGRHALLLAASMSKRSTAAWPALWWCARRPRNASSRSGTESSQTLRWREMDSNFWYRGTKAVGFRSIPGMARDRRVLDSIASCQRKS